MDNARCVHLVAGRHANAVNRKSWRSGGVETRWRRSLGINSPSCVRQRPDTRAGRVGHETHRYNSRYATPPNGPFFGPCTCNGPGRRLRGCVLEANESSVRKQSAVAIFRCKRRHAHDCVRQSVTLERQISNSRSRQRADPFHFSVFCKEIEDVNKTGFSTSFNLASDVPCAGCRRARLIKCRRTVDENVGAFDLG